MMHQFSFTLTPAICNPRARRAAIAGWLWLALASPLIGPQPVAAADDDNFGGVSGQILFDGDPPAREILVKSGDLKVKDPAICAAADLTGDDLIIDPATKGVANVFVYLPKAAAISPRLKASATKHVVFDQKGCRFVPHALFARTDQRVTVMSNDECQHNTHTLPKRGQPINFLLTGLNRDGIPVPNKLAEPTPFEVKCDIHPWMKAWWLILDHPYAAISDAAGKFSITDLPAGDYEFRVWHERAHDIHRALKVTVAAGKTTDLGAIKVPAAAFKN